MKAILCRQLGGPELLELAEVEAPRPGPGEVAIEVHACGVNYPDLLLVAGQYQARPPLPFIPGSEVAGVIIETGAGVDHIALGQRVCAHAALGGFSERMVVPAAAAVPLPEAVPMIEAAGLTIAHGTSHHALCQRAQLRRGETLLVLGAAGGVGLAAVQLGKIIGARVIAAASTAAKLALARDQGADETIDYASQDLRREVKALTAGNGVDVIFDPVGGDLFDSACRTMAWGGRYLVVGFASGRIPKLPVNLPLLKSWQLLGVFWGAFAAREPQANVENMGQLMAWRAAGKFKPVIGATHPLEQAATALATLRDRRARGKIILTTRAADGG